MAREEKIDVILVVEPNKKAAKGRAWITDGRLDAEF